MLIRNEVIKIHMKNMVTVVLERKIKYSDPREIQPKLYLEDMLTNYFVNAIK